MPIAVLFILWGAICLAVVWYLTGGDLKEPKQMKKPRHYKAYSLRILGALMFAYHIRDGLGWIRVFKACVHWKDVTKHRLYFSERNGYRRALLIGKYRISII